MSRQIMTPEQIQRAKSIVGYAAAESLETEEIVLLGWAIQAIAAKDAEIEALREEVCLTNEHEHAIMVELSAARDEIAVDAGRLRDAAMRVWGEDAHGCDTPDRLADAILGLRAQIADLKRGGVVVPDDTFMLHLDTQEEKTPRISINSKKIGVGYDLVSGSIDGHFSRRTYNITPYMRHCLDTIGIHPIPANRVLGEGKVAVDREVLELLLRECEDVLDRYASGCQIQAGELRRALDALRAQATQEPAT